MTKCLVCGKENAGWLCSECAPSCDKEKLCNDFCVYGIGKGQNEIWNTFAEFINNELAFEIIENLCIGLNDGVIAYYKILYFAKKYNSIRKNNIDFLLENADLVLSNGSISSFNKNRIRGLLLNAYTTLYDYNKAEKIANILLEETEIPKYALHSMLVFYSYTRRYEIAEEIYQNYLNLYPDDDYNSIIEKDYIDMKKRRDGEKVEYEPKAQNDADAYFDFLETIGYVREIEATNFKATIKPAKKRRIPKPIPRDEYPSPQKTEGAYFKDFVAFDVETTGKDSVKDSIIELSAVKVKDGKIVETFSELVKPIDKKVSNEITALTGITDEEVKNAREIWEVFPDFAKFVEDDVLVGYNSLAFDSHVLVRAGRYSHIILQNKHLDVMHFSRNYLKQQGISTVVSLVKLGKMLGIENPQAHRALADAETTAKIYLKLLEFEGK